MSDEANAIEFQGSAYNRNYDAARGILPGYYDKAHKTDAGKDFVLGGILQPEPEKIRKGATIFRFSSFSRAATGAAYGVWWISRETAELLARQALSEHHLVSMARQHLAVPDDWSMMTGVFTATLKRPLRAFGGVGGLVHQDPPAQKGGARKGAILPGGTELIGTAKDRSMKRQLFIPGLSKVKDALDIAAIQTVSHWLAAFNRGEL